MMTFAKPTWILGVCLLLAPMRVAEATPIQWSANGHYYDLVTSAVSWDTANAAAAGLSYLGMTGHLATITSDAENTFVFLNIVKPGYDATKPETSGPWIGGYQVAGSTEPSAGWAWVTGEAWTYTNWQPGQPDNGGVPGPPEAYLHYWSNLVGTWNDLGASRTSYYVVEYQPPAPPNPVPDRSSAMGLAAIALLAAVAAFSVGRTWPAVREDGWPSRS